MKLEALTKTCMMIFLMKITLWFPWFMQNNSALYGLKLALLSLKLALQFPALNQVKYPKLKTSHAAYKS